MSKYKFKLNNKEYTAEVLSYEKDNAKIEVNGEVFLVEFEEETEELSTIKKEEIVHNNTVSHTNNHHNTTSLNSLTAPLPGIIIELVVKEGERIKKGQKLAVLEAMKMENEINSDKDGVISKIYINKGDSVLEGDSLFSID